MNPAPRRVVLLVDDSATYRELATYLLRALGYDVLFATNAEDGIAQARTRSPDLILLDMNLPGMGGLEAIRVLRGDAATASLPAIGFTGDSWSEEDDRRAREAGFNAYMTKPVDKATLKKELDCVLP